MIGYYQWGCLATGSRSDDSILSFMRQGKFFRADIDRNNITLVKYYLGTPVELVCYKVMCVAAVIIISPFSIVSLYLCERK